MTVAEVAAVVGGRLDAVSAEDAGVVVTDVVIDSRAAGRGALFVALHGEHVDGHDYAAAATAAGAVAVLAERPVGVPAVIVEDAIVALGSLASAVRERLAGSLRVIAVTGSSGKTSAKDLLGQVLETAGRTVAPAGSYNNDIGLPLTLLSADADTAYVVLEMGSRGPGHIARLCALARPDVGLVLNVGSAHAGEFGDRSATAAAKGELAETAAVVLLNADDPLVAAMASRAGGRVVTYGRSTEADVVARDVRSAGARVSFTIAAGGDTAAVAMRLVGEHHLSNALGAAAVALELGLPLVDVAAALSAAEPRSRWRMEVHTRPDGVTVVNDAYNANPESMAAGLLALVQLAEERTAPEGGRRRTWAVLGQMAELGDGAAAAHDALGQLVARLAVSRLVVVGDEAARIHAGAVLHGFRADDAVLVDDSEAALALVRAGVRPGDVVLVKGSRVAGLERLAAGLLEDQPPGAAP